MASPAEGEGQGGEGEDTTMLTETEGNGGEEKAVASGAEERSTGDNVTGKRKRDESEGQEQI